MIIFFLPKVNAGLLLTSFMTCDRAGPIFGSNANPRSSTKKLAMRPSTTVHGGQHGIKCATFELLLHTAFVADEVGGVCFHQFSRSRVLFCLFFVSFIMFALLVLLPPTVVVTQIRGHTHTSIYTYLRKFARRHVSRRT